MLLQVKERKEKESFGVLHEHGHRELCRDTTSHSRQQTLR